MLGLLTFLGALLRTIVLSANEYKGSSSPAKTPRQNFFDWSDTNHFIHIANVDNKYTWCNSRKGKHLTEKRLDIAVCNIDLLDACTTIICNTLTKIKSDHFPILLNCNFDEIKFISQFKFLKIWSLNEDFLDIIKSSWRTSIIGCPM